MFNKSYFLSVALIVWMTIVTFVVVGQVDAGLQIPVHYDVSGSPDRYAPVGVALWMMVGLAVAILALIHFLPKLDPRIKNVEETRPAIRGIANAFVLFTALLHGGMVMTAKDLGVDMMQTTLVALGVLFLIMGNYISKTRSNFFVGIRTPWTLSSERVWVKTHRLAGRLVVPVSLVVIVLTLVGMHKALFGWLVGALVLSILLPVVYSWITFRQEQKS